MNILDFFGQPDCNFIIYASAAVFLIFLLTARIKNMAAGASCHARMNKANFFFLLVYMAAVAAYCILRHVFTIQILAAFIGGIFIFVTLQQIYLMALIGLVKKSVSVTVVEAAEMTEGIEEKELKKKFSGNADAVRLNRLEQMKYLGLAEETQNIFKITGRGKFFNALGNIILKIWGLERL